MTHQGVLPNTYIIGAAKAGTTSLYDLLAQHPDVYFSFDKEPMFFSRDDYYSRGIDWYKQTYFSEAGNYSIIGEATPHYLYWGEKVAGRIRSAYSRISPKFLVILRNPIERAYSWYWNMKMEGRESLSFSEAIRSEEERVISNWDEIFPYGAMTYGYIRGGEYSRQIESFSSVFGAENLHVMFLDDLRKDPDKLLSELCGFLGIDRNFQFVLEKSNLASMPKNRYLHTFLKNRSWIKDVLKPFIPYRLRYKMKTDLIKINLDPYKYPPMEQNDYIYLCERFIPEIKAVEKLTGRDLSKWLQIP
jgi:hypothetical protein